MEDETRDTYLAETIAQLRGSIEVPPVDPVREQALLAAFDARGRVHREPARWIWPAAAVAATLALAIGSLAIVSREAGKPAVVEPPEATREDPSSAAAGFVPWPGAHTLPPFEGGELRRVELPVSVLPELGLTAPPTAISVVQADVVIGHDGFARAVRLVQQEQLERTQR